MQVQHRWYKRWSEGCPRGVCQHHPPFRSGYQAVLCSGGYPVPLSLPPQKHDRSCLPPMWRGGPRGEHYLWWICRNKGETCPAGTSSYTRTANRSATPPAKCHSFIQSHGAWPPPGTRRGPEDRKPENSTPSNWGTSWGPHLSFIWPQTSRTCWSWGPAGAESSAQCGTTRRSSAIGSHPAGTLKAAGSFAGQGTYDGYCGLYLESQRTCIVCLLPHPPL